MNELTTGVVYETTTGAPITYLQDGNKVYLYGLAAVINAATTPRNPPPVLDHHTPLVHPE